MSPKCIGPKCRQFLVKGLVSKVRCFGRNCGRPGERTRTNCFGRFCGRKSSRNNSFRRNSHKFQTSGRESQNNVAPRSFESPRQSSKSQRGDLESPSFHRNKFEVQSLFANRIYADNNNYQRLSQAVNCVGSSCVRRVSPKINCFGNSCDKLNEFDAKNNDIGMPHDDKIAHDMFNTRMFKTPQRVSNKPLCIGLHCNVNDKTVRPCPANICLNGGTCVRVGYREQCLCLPGFQGRLCASVIKMEETNTKTWIGQPCKNNGIATLAPGGVTCSCTAGFSGKYCQVDINECASDPCKFGGSCQDRVNQYTCKCRSGFDGPRCEVALNSTCEEQPCRNGGSCIEANDTVHCECPDGVYGPRCEVSNAMLRMSNAFPG